MFVWMYFIFISFIKILNSTSNLSTRLPAVIWQAITILIIPILPIQTTLYLFLLFFFQMKKETKKSFFVRGDCCAPFTLMPSCSFYLRFTTINAIPALHSLSLADKYLNITILKQHNTLMFFIQSSHMILNPRNNHSLML